MLRRGLPFVLALGLFGCSHEEENEEVVDLEPARTALPPLEQPPAADYATPVIIGAEVKRVKRKVRSKFTWEAVAGAETYEIQVARAVTFSRTEIDKTIDRTRFATKKLRPGVYFWRVKALGPAGTSAYSQMQVLDATVTGKRRSRRARRRGRRQPKVETQTAKATQLIFELWGPDNKSIFKKPSVQIEGFATPGVVLVAGKQKITAKGEFRFRMHLKHGRNNLRVQATLAEKEKTIERVVYYADPRQLAQARKRFENLRRQLNEVRGLRDELHGTIRELRQRIKQAGDDEIAKELTTELETIQANRDELGKQVEAALKELDGILGG